MEEKKEGARWKERDTSGAGLTDRRCKQRKHFLSRVDGSIIYYTTYFPCQVGFAASMAASRPAAKSDWATPSHLVVFIRNLKLLHLDQREDWPGVTVRSLSPSPQNQRQRIRQVEWALYYLFTIWDPEGAQNVSGFQLPR